MKNNRHNAAPIAAWVGGPLVALAAVAAFKPFGIDPIGEVRDAMQPSCSVSGPTGDVSSALILGGLMNHDNDFSLPETVQLRYADGEAAQIRTEHVTGYPILFELQAGDSLIVDEISEEACSKVNNLVAQLQPAE